MHLWFVCSFVSGSQVGGDQESPSAKEGTLAIDLDIKGFFILGGA